MGDGEEILLKDIWPIENPRDYKIHFGRWNGWNQPLDEWVSDRRRWIGWQRWRPKRNEFNRDYIFSLMDFYHEPGVWLFGGVWRVVKDHKTHYEVELTEQGSPFIGRLKLWSSYGSRAVRVNFENHYDGQHTLQVLEILREPYSGRTSSG